MTDPILLVYITCPNTEVAEALGRHLLEQRVAACVNILSPMQSMYRWKGQVESDPEIPVLAKTVQSRFSALEQAVCTLHPYEVPCIVAWPIGQGHPPFCDWIKEQTRTE